MNWKLIDRVVAGAVFVYALVLYLLTMAPTASFWDAGEFISAVYKLQVGHPPGAPFYMLVGRLFSMFVPPEHVAVAVTLISVLASAGTVLFTHLVVVRLVREWQGPGRDWTASERITALAGGVVGACTFAVTDSFWFNAVEAEVYALSMFFTAAVVWLIMRWSAQARAEEERLAGGMHPFGLAANRYLVLIAYFFGLAIGVHLLNLLALFFIALIFFFTEYDRPEWSPARRWGYIVLAGAVSSLAFLAIYPGIIQWLPSFVSGFADGLSPTGSPFAYALILLAIVAVVAGLVYFTHTRRMQLANLAMLCVMAVMLGYSTYALIVIRSAADPPIDLNDPETSEAFVSYLNREQYGSVPLLKGFTYDDARGQIDRRDETFFPRRHSVDPNHWAVYARYDSDWEFFWDYQIGHMYLRYFLWNFSGRESDVQDAPALTGLPFLDAAAQPEARLLQTPSEHASRNVYFLLPLLLGLVGAVLHFYNDWRRAFAVLVLFLVTGVGIILYLNQPPMQPRERDYSYVASFFAFSLWIGLGAAGLLQLAADYFGDRAGRVSAAGRGALLGLAALLFALVPAWMLYQNYDDHDRSGRYIAPDYAWNMLQSLAPNAIVFTNGDNDTYPLWYLQEVEGVRTDVRVVNLSLLNTPWYIKQLKNQAAYDSEPLPFSLSDAQIDGLGLVAWQPRQMSLPVDRSRYVSEVDFGIEDTSRVVSPMTWTLEGRPYDQTTNYLYAADVAVLDLLRANAAAGWERPIYFAVTVSPSGQLDLQDYFQLEGQAMRVVPIRNDEGGLGRVDPDVIVERLDRFRFTNLDDPDVYYDENIRRMVDNYRNVFARAAEGLAAAGRREEARTLLDELLAEVPFTTIPGDVRSYLLLARTYETLGAEQRVLELMQQAEPLVLHEVRYAQGQRAQQLAAQYVQMLQWAYLDAGDFEAAAAFTDRLAEVLGDDTYRQTAEELRRQFGRAVAPTDTLAAPRPN